MKYPWESQILHEGMAPLLGPLGFEPHSGCLRKTHKDFVWVVELQSESEERFGVGLGVHFPALVAIREPTVRDCALQTTLARLGKRPQFRWQVRPETPLKRVIEEVTVVLLELGLPWLAERKSWSSVLNDPAALYRDEARALQRPAEAES
jgi:hypothetical protein